MTETKMDFSKFEKFDDYTPVDMPILGYKEVTSKKGKQHQLLICQDESGREVSLFGWALCERDGKPYVLKKHLQTALDTARRA